MFYLILWPNVDTGLPLSCRGSNVTTYEYNADFAVTKRLKIFVTYEIKFLSFGH